MSPVTAAPSLDNDRVVAVSGVEVVNGTTGLNGDIVVATAARRSHRRSHQRNDDRLSDPCRTLDRVHAEEPAGRSRRNGSLTQYR